MAKKPSKSGIPLKEYRNDLAKLKKAGLVDKSLNVRSAKPTPALTRKINKYKDVVSGDAKVYTVSKSQASKLKATGQTVVGNKLVLRAEPGTTAEYKKGLIHIKPIGDQGFERIVFPVPFKNLRQWLRDAKKDPSLQNLKLPGDRFAFRYFGNNSYDTFSDIDLLIEKLERYENTEESLEEGSEEAQREVYRNIEIVRVKRGKWKPSPKKPRKYKSYKRKATAAIKRKRMKERSPAQYKRLKEQERIRAKRYRDKKRAAKKSGKRKRK